MKKEEPRQEQSKWRRWLVDAAAAAPFVLGALLFILMLVLPGRTPLG